MAITFNIKIPKIVPITVPLPPLKLVPPRRTAAITINSNPFAEPCWPVSISDAKIIPATPTSKEVITKPKILNLLSLNAGPYLGILIGNTLTLLDEESEFRFTEDLVADLGFSVGTKFIITDALSLNAGYEIELIDLTEDYYSFKNTNIFFGMTYLFVKKYF